MANYNRPQRKLNMDMRGLSRSLGQPLPPPLEPETRMIENKRRFNNNIALTYIGQNPAAAMPKGYRADARMEPYRVNNYYTNDMSLADTENAAGYNQFRDWARDKMPSARAPHPSSPSPDSFDRKDLERNDRMHDKAMRGGDDTLSYTETGDIVIPRHAAEANPGLAMAAMNVLAQMGANPQQYVAGSPEGSYNPDTGAQEFAWYTDLMKWGTKAADYVGSRDWAKSAATGALTYGTSKLMGNDSKSAKYQALGAGLGTYGGLKFDQKFGKGVEPYSMTTPATGDDGTFTPQDLYGALKEAAGSVGKAGARGGALGAGIGTMLAPAPPAFSPDLNIGPVVPMGLGAVKPMAEFRKDFAQNEQPNLSDTLSKPAPVAPITPMPMMPEGVTYQNQVRDRNTGEYRYAGANNPADQSAFARAIKGASRRRGYGNMILV
jgi:hypothetical protein